MKAYHLVLEGEKPRLTFVDLPDSKPVPGQVVVRVRATSLNFRDPFHYRPAIVTPRNAFRRIGEGPQPAFDLFGKLREPAGGSRPRYPALKKFMFTLVVLGPIR